MKRPLVWFTWSFGACLLLESLWIDGTRFLFFIALAAALLAGIRAIFHSDRRKQAAAALFFAAFCAFSVRTLYDCLVYAPIAETDGKTRNFVLTAEEDAVGKKSYGMVTVRIERIDGRPVRGRASAILYLEDASPDIRAGDRITGEMSAELPEKGLDFDSFSYNKAKKIYLTLSETGGMEIEKLERPSWLFRARRLSSDISEILAERLPEESAGLAAALITGDQSRMTPTLRESLTASGLSHIAAVSGLHISILMGFLWMVMGKRTGAVASLPVLLLFVAMTGFSPSAVRASVMHLAACGAFFLRREKDSLSALALALLLILLANPYAVRDVRLILSFLSTLGILLFSERFSEAFRLIAARAPERLSRIARWAADSQAAAFGAMVLSLPASAAFFSRVSLIAPLSNLLVVPLIAPAFLLSGAAGISGLWSTGVSALLAEFARPVLALILVLSKGLASLPFASVPLESLCFIGLLVSFYAVAFLWRKTGKDGWKLPAGMWVAALMAALIFTGRMAERAVSVTALPTGGPTVVLRQGSRAVLVDCGPGKNGNAAWKIRNHLVKNRLNAELLVLTHIDEEHAGAAPELIQEGLTDRVMLSFTDAENAALASEIAETARKSGVELLAMGERVEAGSLGVSIHELSDGERMAEMHAGNISALSAHVDNLYAAEKKAKELEGHFDLLLVDGGHIISVKSLDRICEEIKPKIVLIPDKTYGEPLLLPMETVYGEMAGEVRLQGWGEKDGKEK